MSNTPTTTESTTEEVVITKAEDRTIVAAIRAIGKRNLQTFTEDLAEVRKFVTMLNGRLSTREFAERYECSQTEAQIWFAAAKLEQDVVDAYLAEPRKSRSLSALVAFNRNLGKSDEDGDETPDPWVKRPSRVTAKVRVAVRDHLVKVLTKAGYTEEEIDAIFAAE